MCGIVGMIGVGDAPADPQTIQRMNDSQVHRGPDDDGVYLNGRVGFGFRRLSIQDLSEDGHQPMVSPDGQVVIVFNGEIYNFIELRDELRGLGHAFRSTGDTEVLLHAYLEWGMDCVERLNGMWGFMIHDARRNVVVGSRDRFGQKPLFLHRSRRHLLFASEIKSILASGHYEGGIDWDVASRLLFESSLSAVPVGRDTFFRDIVQVPPGTSIEIDASGRVAETRFWSIPSAPASADVLADPVAAYADLFEDSIRLRKRSDVPVGVFLSGGLDSTAVICASERVSRAAADDAPLLAFSFHSEEYDESRWVADTIEQTGAQLVRHDPEPGGLWARLEQLLHHQDEPVHSFSALGAFELSRLASEHGVKAILSGGGADEYLGGYPPYFENYWHGLLRRGAIGQAREEIEAFCEVHGADSSELMRSSLRAFRSELSRLGAYRSLAGWRQRRALRENDWYSSDVADHLDSRSAPYQNQKLEAALRRSMTEAPLPLYLRTDDRSSMAFGVELRSPFLDYRLVSQVFGLSDDWKVRGAWNKYLLREAMKNRIPESVRQRPEKWGFPTPGSRWFAEQLYEPTRDLLHEKRVRERGIYDVDAIGRDLERHRSGEIRVESQLFNFVQFETWIQQQEARLGSFA